MAKPCPTAVGATLVVARVSAAVHRPKTGDHKGRPYGAQSTSESGLNAKAVGAEVGFVVGGDHSAWGDNLVHGVEVGLG